MFRQQLLFLSEFFKENNKHTQKCTEISSFCLFNCLSVSVTIVIHTFLLIFTPNFLFEFFFFFSFFFVYLFILFHKKSSACKCSSVFFFVLFCFVSSVCKSKLFHAFCFQSSFVFSMTGLVVVFTLSTEKRKKKQPNTFNLEVCTWGEWGLS